MERLGLKRVAVTASLCAALSGCSGGDSPTTTPTGTASSTPTPTVPPSDALPEGAISAGALVTPTDLGPGWTTAPAAAAPCPPAFARSALRSSGLAERRGTLTETIATGVDVAAVVSAWGRSLRACGFAVRDDGLGDAAVSAHSSKASEAVMITGTEGVLVVMHATGELAGAQEELEGWADLALGTSCVAAPDGCH